MKTYPYFFILPLLLLAAGQLQAAGPLFQFLGKPELNERQKQFERSYLSEKEVVAVHYFKVDFELFKKEELEVNLPGERPRACRRKYKSEPYGQIEAWVGAIGDEAGTAFLVPNPKSGMLTGTIYYGAKTYAIRSLAGGIQLLMEMDFSGSEGCGVSEKEEGEDSPNPRPLSPVDGNTDGFTEESGAKSADGLALSSGECRIRVLVAYTNEVDELEADPLALILNAVAQTNDAYANSGISHRIELARVYHTDFDDTGLGQGTVLNRWRINGDGFMDEVHTERTRWRADMCALITNVGTGIARVSSSYANTFSCTRRTYVSNRTFQHELGHNFTCQHDPSDYAGSSIYRGWGHPEGYFRTIMAYPQACGEDVEPCNRVNEFSGPFNWYWHAPTNAWYTTGTATNNCVLGHENNSGIIVDHEVVFNNGTYSGDYDIRAHEAVHMAANNSFGYSSNTNQFELHNNSQGSFRAGRQVVLGRGFRARRGSSFRAFIENCAALAADGEEETAISPPKPPAAEAPGQMELSVFPNPVKGEATVAYALHEAGPVSIQLFSLSGKLVREIITSGHQEAGSYQLAFNGRNLSPGTYFCRMTTNTQAQTVRVLIAQ